LLPVRGLRQRRQFVAEPDVLVAHVPFPVGWSTMRPRRRGDCFPAQEKLSRR
jgi:hypothetical protein